MRATGRFLEICKCFYGNEGLSVNADWLKSFCASYVLIKNALEVAVFNTCFNNIVYLKIDSWNCSGTINNNSNKLLYFTNP